MARPDVVPPPHFPCTTHLYLSIVRFFFFFNDTATTEIYTLSLHDALPISSPGTIPTTGSCWARARSPACRCGARAASPSAPSDRKSTRLNSSHGYISYAVFCLKKKKQHI